MKAALRAHGKQFTDAFDLDEGEQKILRLVADTADDIRRSARAGLAVQPIEFGHRSLDVVDVEGGGSVQPGQSGIEFHHLDGLTRPGGDHPRRPPTELRSCHGGDAGAHSAAKPSYPRGAGHTPARHSADAARLPRLRRRAAPRRPPRAMAVPRLRPRMGTHRFGRIRFRRLIVSAVPRERTRHTIKSRGSRSHPIVVSDGAAGLIDPDS
jgi:hypothetical protein